MSEATNAVYLMVQGEEKGPFTLNQVHTMWDAGLVAPDTMCKKTEEWQPLVNAMSGASQQSQPVGRCFLRVRDEEKGPFTFDQVRSMWNAGHITADTMYRMTDGWQPLAIVLSRVTVQAPPISYDPHRDASSSYSFLKLFLPRGRIGRGEYFLLFFGSLAAFCILFYLITPLVESKSQGINSFAAIIVLCILLGWLYFELIFAAKRFHDLNLPGWLAPLCFLPLVPLFLFILSGTNGPNKYGPA